MSHNAKLDRLCVDTIRTLSIEAVQRANSGHPGIAMAVAPVVYTLWQCFLRFDPDDPIWPDRDRFVLSIGPCLDAMPPAKRDRRPGERPARCRRGDGQQEMHFLRTGQGARADQHANRGS